MTLPFADKYDIARGSSDIPLLPEGRAKLCAAGCALAGLCGGSGAGRISKIYTSDLQRTRESGKILKGCLGSCIPCEHNANLDPWYQGWIEGQTVDPRILTEMQRLQVDDPGETPPGRGPLSTHPGESFNNYKQRFLRTMIPIMTHYKESLLTPCPDRVVIVNHYRGIKVMEAWCAKGTPPNMTLDNAELLRHDGAPGDIHRLYIDPSGGWKITAFDATNQEPPLPPGIYIIRHGQTAWNAPGGSNAR
jgi:broad specificity phosphatase PhoE